MAKILVVDDDIMTLEFIKIYLEGEGFEVSIASNQAEAFELIAGNIFDILICDLNLGEESGEDVVKIAIQNNPNLKVALVTGYEQERLDKLEIKYDAYFKKPIDLDLVQKKLGTLLK